MSDKSDGKEPSKIRQRKSQSQKRQKVARNFIKTTVVADLESCCRIWQKENLVS